MQRPQWTRLSSGCSTGSGTSVTYLVISDIHANLEALDATLAAAGHHEHILVLGDMVGYGADPNGVIDRVRALPTTAVIRGNHDKVSAGIEGVDTFNPVARKAIEWTTSALTADNRAWLAALPQGPVRIDDLTEICHGTPHNEDQYVFDPAAAAQAIRSAHQPLCLYGHTHVPAVYSVKARAQPDDPWQSLTNPTVESTAPVVGSPFVVQMDDQSKYLVNCGAVGQPRDGDPRAAYGILDTAARSVTIVRTPYDVTAAMAKIVAAGLPDALARRLAAGR